MGSDTVDLGLRDGSHADLIKGSCEERGEGRNEDYVPVSAGQSDSHADHVLLGNEALDKPVGEGVLVGEGEGGILGVSIKSHNAVIALPQLD